MTFIRNKLPHPHLPAYPPPPHQLIPRIRTTPTTILQPARTSKRHVRVTLPAPPSWEEA
ncbi:hypothetical protein [Sporisorium scitamineum]|uniref:Uncharacterized protein n=1 Tax=Sporisorium scitamineum TaxID=49012 RepID=A0A0F7SDP5_9BASI|nr:hypothetical protein [Sporisorium scitamineum]